MRFVATTAALLALTGCGSASDEARSTAKLTAAEAVQMACEEVRAGIDDFNRKDYRATVRHFRHAQAPAKRYAQANSDPGARELLDAVEYYARLTPDHYPQAAQSSKRFAHNIDVTLEQCAAGEPIDHVPPASV